MRIIYGTGNPAKIQAMRSRLSGLPIEIVGIKETGKELPAIVEDGKTPLENAIKKASGYYRVLKEPVFSCDSGLYIDELPEHLQPGVHVRTVGGRTLTDEEMIDYYASLAKEYGDLTARYRNAICLVMDEEHIYSAMEPSMASEPFLITSKPHPVRNEGFPLDSLSIDIKTGKYYYDISQEATEEKDADILKQIAVEDGFLTFFQKVLEAEYDRIKAIL